jgi:hypothetical protein
VNEHQYQRLRDNRRVAGPRPLGEARPGADGRISPLAAVLAQAARKLRRREAGTAARQRVAPPAWLAHTVVEGVEGDTLVIGARGSSLCYELGRQQTALERQIARLAPGLHRLRFVVAAARSAPAAGVPR